jgi:hypothetical protein
MTPFTKGAPKCEQNAPIAYNYPLYLEIKTLSDLPSPT